MAARDAAPFKKRLSEAIFGLTSRGEPSVLFVVPGHWRGLQRLGARVERERRCERGRGRGRKSGVEHGYGTRNPRLRNAIA